METISSFNIMEGFESVRSVPVNKTMNLLNSDISYTNCTNYFKYKIKIRIDILKYTIHSGDNWNDQKYNSYIR